MFCSGRPVQSDLLGFSSFFRLGSSSDLLGPFLPEVFNFTLTRMPVSDWLIPYIPWETADCFPKAELSHKHHPVYTGSDDITSSNTGGEKSDLKWWLEVVPHSGSNTGSSLVWFKSHAMNPQNSLDIHCTAAQAVSFPKDTRSLKFSSTCSPIFCGDMGYGCTIGFLPCSPDESPGGTVNWLRRS